MLINKMEIFKIYKMSMGCHEDEEKRRAIEFIDKLYVGNGNTRMTPEGLWQTLDNILVHVLENTGKETEEGTEDETEDETEAARQFVCDFFFKW